jgi:hypothetical protein
MAKNHSKHAHHSVTPSSVAAFLGRYSWVIGKNVVGWVLILVSFPIAGLFPGPLGLPLFLIGFGLVNFPGKRHLTARILRGIPFDLHSRQARLGRLAAALLLPPLTVWILALKRHPVLHPSQMSLARLCAMYAVAMVATWIVSWLFLLVVNLVLKLISRMRRRIRPWLRRHGIKLLRLRKKRRARSAREASLEQQIIEIDSKAKDVKRVKKFWKSLTQWM